MTSPQELRTVAAEMRPAFSAMMTEAAETLERRDAVIRLLEQDAHEARQELAAARGTRSDMVAAVRELLQLHAENAALQQGYDAARMEIDHLRGVTKMMEPAQPVAWLVYLPSIDTQNVYDSQDDPGYVDDVTNHDDAVVTPLYQMAVPAGHALVPVTGITAKPTTLHHSCHVQRIDGEAQ